MRIGKRKRGTGTESLFPDDCLEHHFQRELYLPFRAEACGRKLSEAPIRLTGIRVDELRCVGQVKELRTELRGHSLAHLKVLEGREVDVNRVRTSEEVAGSGSRSHGNTGAVGRHRREGCGVEVLERFGHARVWQSYQVAANLWIVTVADNVEGRTT